MSKNPMPAFVITPIKKVEVALYYICLNQYHLTLLKKKLL